MKIDRYYTDATKEEKLDQEMQDEIYEQKRHLERYNYNIKSLLGDKRSKEVKKAMINFLVESL